MADYRVTALSLVSDQGHPLIRNPGPSFCVSLALVAAPDEDSNVWVIALDGLSLHKYSGGTWQPEYYLEGVEAESIAVDREGNPWFVRSADGR